MLLPLNVDQKRSSDVYMVALKVLNLNSRRNVAQSNAYRDYKRAIRLD